MKTDFGKIRIVILRSFFLISLCNFMMLVKLFLENNGWNWWYLMVPVVIGFYMAFDWKKTYPQELSQNVNNTEEIVQLINDVKEIKGLLK